MSKRSSRGSKSREQSSAVRLNRWTYRLANNWLRIVIVALVIYVSLPFAAPVLMRIGATGPAQVIYDLYGPLCHQFAFRSFFLFGEQSAYPRYNVPSDLTPFETAAAESEVYVALFDDWYARFFGQGFPSDPTAQDLEPFSAWYQQAASEFVGDETMGYKTALCQRDIAIYAAILGFALFFARFRRRIRPLPIWMFILIGAAPIGLDGFSQILSYPPISLWPARESLPIFRVVTGAMFGFAVAWLGFPWIEDAMVEAKENITAKFARAGLSLIPQPESSAPKGAKR